MKHLDTMKISSMMKTYLSEKCEVCGKKTLYEEDGETKCHFCETVGDENKRLEREAAEEERRFLEMQNQKTIELFEKNSVIPVDLIGKTFDDFIAEHETQKKGLQIAKRYADNFDINNPVKLFLWGEQVGCGKSQLAYCIARQVSQMKKNDDESFTTLFINIPQFLENIKSTYNKNSDVTEADIMKMVADVDLLVIDELKPPPPPKDEKERKNFKPKSEWAGTKEYQIFNARLGKHTVMTSNTPRMPEDKGYTPGIPTFRELMPADIFSRAFQDSVAVRMTGLDRRTEKLMSY